MPSSNEKRGVRVRFAPSPTGFLHVGGARTAIFNWLYARHEGGVFVLRIEDTDVERSTGESERVLLSDLEWLGLDWDEGPGVGGPFSPYRQSERLELYAVESDRLLGAGLAYPCFCSEEELERKRREAMEIGKPPQYDGTCRKLKEKEVERKRSEGLPEVVRFRVGGGEVSFNDCIRGEVILSTSMVGDFVLLRSNGLPTYNFAAVVDDVSMGITHVLRGEEHLSNTLRQIMLYRALEARPPVFGHLPLILGEDRSKLSKRHGSSTVAELRKSGFLPRAVVNYLALLGWSHPSGKEFMPLDELVSAFSLQRVGESPSVFDGEKLTWMNGMHIRNAPADLLYREADAFFPEEIKRLYPEEKRKEILALVKDSMGTLSEVPSLCAVFNKEVRLGREAKDALGTLRSGDVLRSFAGELGSCQEEFTPGIAREMIGKVGRELGMKGKELYLPIRAAVTGSVHGPELSGILAVKGREMVLALVKKALEVGR